MAKKKKATQAEAKPLTQAEQHTANAVADKKRREKVQKDRAKYRASL